jgi:septum formation protein
MSSVPRRKRLVLASGSPRRKDLLSGMGFELDIVRSNADEEQQPGEKPEDMARRLARAKAAEVAERHYTGCDEFVLGADTIVVLGGRVLQKPVDEADARRMLGLLSGATHTVITAFCIVNPARGVEVVRHVATEVTFREMSPDWMDRYIRTGEPMDKAGAYAAQGVGASIIARIEGSYTNVVGLPLYEVAGTLESLGMEVI